MSQIQSIVNSLLARAATVDPVMLSILQEIINELDRLGIVIDPAPITEAKVSNVTASAPEGIAEFNYELTSRNVILTWEPIGNDFVFYELRKGNTWDTATRILATSNIQAILDPVAVGTHTYLLKTLSTTGVYSADTASVTFTVPAIGTVVITPEVLDQNILLRWTVPNSTFAIDYYRITRNGAEFSQTRSNFHVLMEQSGGSFEYGIIPVDIAGNEGTESTSTVLLSDPADFILYATQLADLETGTINNAKFEDDRLLLPVNITETYEDHFIDNSWASPQEQVDAGYTRWLSPSAASGYYEHTFDYGVIFTNVIVSLSWAIEIVQGAFTVGIDARVSDDDISYSAAHTTQNFFVSSVRYLKVRITFTGGDDKALLWFYNFIASISVREELDSGTVIADAGDVLGTVVEFSKSFYDVTSITVSVKSEKEPIDAIYTFNDVPNPTEFNVFAYDFAGRRVTKQVDWKARGIL